MHPSFRVRPLRTALLALAMAMGPARAADATPRPADAPGSVGLSIGGGKLVGAAGQVRLSPGVWLDAELGLRPGFSFDQDALYGSLTAGGGVSAVFGAGRTRHGAFGSVAAGLVGATRESWLAAGWTVRIPSPNARIDYSLDVGPALYLARTLPVSTGLGTVPAYVHVRFAMRIPVGARPAPPPAEPAPPPAEPAPPPGTP